MRITYKCRCMAAETCIDVPDRRPGADVVTWMETVQMNVGADHRALSPLCVSGATEYVKIPMDDASPQLGTPATRQ